MDPLDADLIAAINRYLLIRTPLEPANLCFVFGTRPGAEAFAEETARLWLGGHFEYCLISGGITPGGAEPEALMLRRMIIRQGVPGSVIMIEDRATNTGENVAFSLPILDREIGLHRIEKLIAVGKLCTSRRYLMTLQQHWPEVGKMLAPVNFHPVPPTRWMDHQELRDRILREWSKLEPYQQKGFITELQSETCHIL